MHKSVVHAGQQHERAFLRWNEGNFQRDSHNCRVPAASHSTFGGLFGSLETRLVGPTLRGGTSLCSSATSKRAPEVVVGVVVIPTTTCVLVTRLDVIRQEDAHKESRRLSTYST